MIFKIKESFAWQIWFQNWWKKRKQTEHSSFRTQKWCFSIKKWAREREREIEKQTVRINEATNNSNLNGILQVSNLSAVIGVEVLGNGDGNKEMSQI